MMVDLMPRTKSTSREALIRRLNKAYHQISCDVDAITIDDVIDQYRDEFERGIKGYASISSEKKLISRIIESDIVYHGDYHTLARSQGSVADILDKIYEHRNINLFMEMFHSSDQDKIDEFIAGEKTIQGLYDSIKPQNRWYFEWKNYAPILELAQAKNIWIRGSNFRNNQGLTDRDYHEAAIIAAHTISYPESIAYVMHGQFHNARAHVPDKVDMILQQFCKSRKRLIIDQNIDSLYWELARQGREKAGVLRLSKDRYCLMNTNPLDQVTSFVNWLEFRDEMPGRNDNEFRQSMLKMAISIGDFFCIDEDKVREEFENVKIYRTTDLNFYADLKGLGFDRDFIRYITLEADVMQSCYFPKHNLLWLPNLALAEVAEEVSHWLNYCVSGYADTQTNLDSFYDDVLREAIGYLGSKVYGMNRTAESVHFMRKFIAESKKAEKLSKDDAILASAYGEVLHHKKMETEVIRSKHFVLTQRLADMYNCDNPMYDHIVYALGYPLGDKLFEAFKDGRLPKEEIGILIRSDFSENNSGLQTYLHLIKQI